MTITLTGRLSECLLLSYSAPARAVRALVPEGLTLVTHRERAFWNVVVSRIDRMKLRGMPRWTGISYHHVAYRLHVVAGTNDELCGLYFLRSDVDSAVIARAGNPLSDFAFHRSRVELRQSGETLSLDVRAGDDVGSATLVVDTSNAVAPKTGLFRDEAEREAVLKYRPLGLAIGARGGVRLAEVSRDEAAWSEQHVQVTAATWQFLNAYDQSDLRLERATRVAPLDYTWRLGRSLPPGEEYARRPPGE